MGKKKGKNSSARAENPAKGQSLQNSLQYELARYKWENSVRGQQLAAQNLYLDQFNLTNKTTSAFPQLKLVDSLHSLSARAAAPGAASALQRTWGSMKEADRNKEAAAAARWHYSSPLVRKARELLLTNILAAHGAISILDTENSDLTVSSRAAGNGNDSVQCLSDLCLVNIAANLKRYDITELKCFMQVHMEPVQLLQVAAHATRLHTLDDDNIAAVTPHLAKTVVCPRDFTHVGLQQLLHSYQTNAFVLHDDWEQVDLGTFDLHKLVGPRELYVIGSAFKVASFLELRSVFSLEQLTLHAVAVPPDLPRLPKNAGASIAAGKYGVIPDKLEVLHKICEYGLGSEADYSNLLFAGGSNPYVMPGAMADEAAAQDASFACAAVLCSLFLTSSRAAGDKTSKKMLELSQLATSAPTSAASAMSGFENLARVSFCHCKWGWSVESLLLFAYRLSAAQQESCGGSSLRNLKCITVSGADIFKPPALSAFLADVDARKTRRVCAVFHEICSVQLIVDGHTCTDLRECSG